MSTDFCLWRPGPMKDGICKLLRLSNVPDDFEIHDGISRLSGWPAKASASMNPKFPRDIGLADSLQGSGFVVISADAKRFLETHGVGSPERKGIEYLPMAIINHKGRNEAAEYFIVNPLDSVDCIDMEASAAEMCSLIKGEVSGCSQLILREDVIPPDLQVFRLGLWPSRIIIRRSFADRMNAAGLTGMRFLNPAEYNGLW